MRQPTSSIPPEALLRHASFVRSLARGLACGEQDADDLVQQTWVTALERPPTKSDGVRAWLGTVVRNVARMAWRTQARRPAWERAAARPERLPPASEKVERESALREVVDAVLSLEEPYRSTILLRYYEDVPAREIADREGLSVATVRSRLQRALAQLRERLDRAHGGDRDAWSLALISLTAIKTKAATATVGGMVMQASGVLATSAKVAAVALISFGAIFFWWNVKHDRSEPPAVSESRASAPPSERRSPVVEREGASPRQSEETEPTGLQATPAQPAHPSAEEAEDITILRVKATSLTGSPVVAGILECVAAENHIRVEWPSAYRVFIPIAGEVTEIRLTPSFDAALLTASAQGLTAGQLRVERLRWAAGQRVEHGAVVKDVTVVLGSELPFPSLTGRITVDGMLRVPPGLRILLWHKESGAPTAAMIDYSNSSYAYAPVSDPGRGLWVSCEEAAPAWIPLNIASVSENVVQDVDLVSGITLKLHLVDKDSGAPVAGKCVEVLASVEIERKAWQSTSQSRATRATSDPSGDCTIPGLPPVGSVRLHSCAERGSPTEENIEVRGGGDLLARFELTPDLPKVLSKTVAIRTKAPALRDVWGYLPEQRDYRSCCSGTVPNIAFMALRDGQGKSVERGGAHEDGKWVVRAEADVPYEFWLANDYLRVSNVVRVEPGSGSSVGPLSFVARVCHRITLRWRGAMPGSRMKILESSDGTQELVAAFTTNSNEGSRSLVVVAQGQLRVQATSADGEGVVKELGWAGETGSEFVVDLGVSR